MTLPVDPSLRENIQRALDGKTKPLGALGRLEELALTLGTVLGTERPALVEPQVVVFAADHGLAAHGVSTICHVTSLG